MLKKSSDSVLHVEVDKTNTTKDMQNLAVSLEKRSVDVHLTFGVRMLKAARSVSAIYMYVGTGV